MKLFFHLLLVLALFSACHPSTSNEKDTAAYFPGLLLAKRLGNEVAQENQLHYKKSSLFYTGRRVFFRFEFINEKDLSTQEMRIVVIRLIDSITQKLAQEPAIASQFSSAEQEKSIRKSIELSLSFGAQKPVNDIKEIQVNACCFASGYLNYVFADAKNGLQIHQPHRETYEEAKVLLQQQSG
ncbi:MAG TPA: hypothetical protein VN457_05940 [Chlamydiales bacterium]|nr:hypothetical protein [Chlamydiales bacterium]